MAHHTRPHRPRKEVGHGRISKASKAASFAGLSLEIYYHYKYYLDYIIRLALGLAGIQEASPCLLLIVQLQISNDVCKNLSHFFLVENQPYQAEVEAFGSRAA